MFPPYLGRVFVMPLEPYHHPNLEPLPPSNKQDEEKIDKKDCHKQCVTKLVRRQTVIQTRKLRVKV